MSINIEPTKDHPVPYSTDKAETSSFSEELAVTANTQDLLEQLGGTIPEMSPEDAAATAKLAEAAIKKQDKGALSSPGVAFSAREFLRVYSARLAVDVSDVRSALTNKLLELANCGDPRFELKALELLGKHSDIALFTERSEVTVTYKNATDLESAIKERIKRLLKTDVSDVEPITPRADVLDAELGVASRQADDKTGELGDKSE
jgi:hypothetical protein